MKGAGRETRLPALAAVATPLVLVLALYGRVLFRDEALSSRDLTAYHRPMLAMLASVAERTGGLPEWNPLVHAGQPLAANPAYHAFHPFTWLLFVLPFEWALRLQILLPVLLAAGTMAFLARTCGAGFEGSLLAGVVFAFGGYAVSLTHVPSALLSMSAMPAVLGAALRAWRAPGRRNAVLLAGAVALFAVSFEPFALLAAALAGACALAFEAGASPPSPHRVRASVAALAGGVLLGAGLAAIALLPGLRHAASTDRAAGIEPRFAHLWSMPPLRLLELVFPHPLGQPTAGGPWWGASFYPDRTTPFLVSLYPSLLAALLALSFAIRRPRRAAPWLLAAAIGSVLAAGGNLPAWDAALSLFPPLRSLRYPEKLASLVPLAVSLLAGLGFHEAIRGEAARRSDATRAGLLASIFLAGAALAAGGGDTLDRALGPFTMDGAGAGASRFLAGSLLASAGIAAAGAVLFAARERLGPGLFTAACLTLVAVDLVRVARPHLPSRPVAALQAPPRFLLPAIAGRDDGPLYFAPDWRSGAASADLVRTAPPVPSLWGIATDLERDFDVTQLRWSVPPSLRFWDAVTADPSLALPLLARRGVAWVVRAPSAAPARTASETWGPDLQLVRPVERRPFAFCARRVEIVDGAGAWHAAVSRLGADLADTALVETSFAAGLPAAPAPGTARVLSRRPGWVSIDVSGAGPGPSVLLVNQTWHPDWTANLDGRPVAVRRTDLDLSALLVPEGTHRVDLAYADPWIRRGSWLSAFSAVLAIVLVAARGRRVHGAGSPSGTFAAR